MYIMDEYLLRNKISNYIQLRIDKVIDEYCEIYKDNIGFLFYYPLIKLENRFLEEDPNHENAVIDRKTVSWFLKEVEKHRKQQFEVENFIYIPSEYATFEMFYETIERLYNDYRMSEEIHDMNSIGKVKINNVDTNKYEVISSFIDNSFIKETAYYEGLDNPKEFMKEKEIAHKPIQYIIEKYTDNPKKIISRLKRLLIDIDHELLEICEERVNVDIKKMGTKVKSNIIRGTRDLNRIVGFLFYFSFISVQIVHFKRLFKDFDVSDTFIYYDKEWFVRKIYKTLSIDEQTIERYLGYFKFDSRGTVLEFPIFNFNKKIFFIPSSIMLNDWQFSIVNGHYCKKIDFIDREKTISKSIISNIDNKISKFNNVIFCKEKYYEYKDVQNNIKNSDIDVAIYDINSNCLLVIECKWKDNHYASSEDDENYIKVQDTHNKIFNEQISRHEEFLTQNKKNIDFIFDYNELIKNRKDEPRIFYLAIDKRSQLHLAGRHMLSIYVLLYMFDKYSEGNIIFLDKIIDEISKLETEVKYFFAGTAVEFQIDEELTILSDELYLNY